MEEKGILQNSSFEDTIILMSKLDKNITSRENYKSISLNNINIKILNKEWIQHYIERIIYHCQLGFILRMQRWFSIWKSMNIIHFSDRLEKKNSMIMSIEAAEKNKHLLKQHSFKIKSLRKPGIKDNFLMNNLEENS